MKVQFTEVGRDRRSWVAEMSAPLTEEALGAEVRSQVRVMSRGLEFMYTTETGRGVIFAGDHTIGTFTVIEA